MKPRHHENNFLKIYEYLNSHWFRFGPADQLNKTRNLQGNLNNNLIHRILRIVEQIFHNFYAQYAFQGFLETLSMVTSHFKSRGFKSNSNVF